MGYSSCRWRRSKWFSLKIRFSLSLFLPSFISVFFYSRLSWLKVAMYLLLFRGLKYDNILLVYFPVSPRLSPNSVLKIWIEMTTGIVPDFFLSLSRSSSGRFFFYCLWLLCLFLSLCIHSYLLYARMYIGMCNGMGRRAPVGAIVAAQITMPDRRRGQTF